ncbi:Glycylpeptide N-tetradecanoyltransferase [Spironucleus salmonicida]|uniref:Glycylpeptide N-tetradecanoyltransferase n=1 Tax=Spironucleus salmonicida TaxID=348837 RepID=V6M035_9EUKA|nr:Glycylpeptide N-tetradecanoyltransferase [Spironucleus salmonicida]|eukprot:EST46484.1 Glycylpeptide N-tetradecanoyltransferase [Spironucleus salmonicida]
MSDPEQHNFWPSQPVGRDASSTQAKIISPVDRSKIQQTPITVPEFLEFQPLTLPENLDELFTFLASHYVGDAAGTSRFAYSRDFLTWWIGSQSSNLAIALRAKSDYENIKTGDICGFISGLPMDYQYKEIKTVSQSVDFLCVHQTLRSMNLAPLLIQEITRRSYKNNVQTAIFTAAFTAKQKNPAIPPVLTSTYFHRLLNPVKLMQCNFCQKPYNMDLKKFEFVYRLPAIKQTLRKMSQKDISDCYKIYTNYQDKYVIKQLFSKKLFEKIFKSKDNVVQSFVYDVKGQVAAFISYYIVDSQMLSPEVNKMHKFIRNGYILQYGISDEVENNIDLSSLVLCLMHEMYKAKIDVCTCLDICKNMEFIAKLRFDPGDGKLCYHAFNMDWGKELQKHELGVVLV